MHDQQWTLIKHFNKNENWGDLDLLKFNVVQELDFMRRWIEKHPKYKGCRFIVHRAATYFCGKYSRHRHGDAVDGRLVWPDGNALPLSDQFIILSRFNFSAIGLYPYWHVRKSDGTIEEAPGVHVDMRPLSRESGEPRKLWVKWRNGGQYLSFDGLELAIMHCHHLGKHCLLGKKYYNGDD